MVLKKTLISLASQMQDKFSTFEERVELGFSRNNASFRKNVESRGVNLEKEIENTKYDSADDIDAVQKVDDELRVYSKEDLLLNEFGD